MSTTNAASAAPGSPPERERTEPAAALNTSPLPPVIRAASPPGAAAPGSPLPAEPELPAAEAPGAFPPSPPTVPSVPAVPASMTAPAPPTPVIKVVQVRPTPTGPGLFVRTLWFLLIGWWLGYLWAVTAWLLGLSLVGLPLALLMFDRLPQVMTLKPTPVGSSRVTVTQAGTATTVVVGEPAGPAQRPFWLRALYFVLVGWWFSVVWLILAYLAGATLIGLPLMFWMVNRIPAITTLSRP